MELGKGLETPVVLLDTSIAKLVRYLLDNSSPGTILVCCSKRSSFAEQLERDIQKESPTQHASRGRHPLLEPTLKNLSASDNVRVAFCPSISALHAYLSQIAPFSQSAVGRDSNAPNHQSLPPLLIILNMLRVHHDTVHDSVQGLGRAFAAAVEAALRSGAHLRAVECFIKSPEGNDEGNHAFEPSFENRRDSASSDVETISRQIEPGRREFSYDAPELRQDTTTEGPCNEAVDVDGPPEQLNDLWDKEVPVLSVTTKTFGSDNDRAWLDRTVRIRDLASKWFRFENAGQ